MNFTEREQKEMIFDEIMVKHLGNSYRERWIADDKKYSYGKENKKFLLEVSKPAGVIYRRYFSEDVIGKIFNIKWSNIFGN